ncbi:MAG: hypothetical protein ACT6FF_09360 [Methanosarcinaceae archaeon]
MYGYWPITLVTTLGMSLLASCVSALIAARKYPADILREVLIPQQFPL